MGSMLELDRNIWLEQRRFHEERVRRKIDRYLEKRSAHIQDPIFDFLFDYYSFRPSLLERWSPGLNVLLKDAGTVEMPVPEEWIEESGGIRLHAEIPEKRRHSLRWIIELLQQTSLRAPKLGCMGLHEWAMVYKTERRHEKIPLRLSPAEIDAFVEKSTIRCTHWDAFRFFSEPARPMNKIQPSSDSMNKLEQPGCLHTNMDLYKWSYKFYPFVSSELIWSCFELAYDIRTLDMQSSPYDMARFGLAPVCIETSAGQLEYTTKQDEFFRRAEPLRQRLIEELFAVERAIQAELVAD